MWLNREKALVVVLGRICETRGFRGHHAAVAELGPSLTLKANYYMCPLTGGFSKKGVFE